MTQLRAAGRRGDEWRRPVRPRHVFVCPSFIRIKLTLVNQPWVADVRHKIKAPTSVPLIGCTGGRLTPSRLISTRRCRHLSCLHLMMVYFSFPGSTIPDGRQRLEFRGDSVGARDPTANASKGGGEPSDGWDARLRNRQQEVTSLARRETAPSRGGAFQALWGHAGSFTGRSLGNEEGSGTGTKLNPGKSPEIYGRVYHSSDNSETLDFKKRRT